MERVVDCLSPLPLLADLTQVELAQWCEAQGHGAYRADQIRRWVFSKRVATFEAMHDLPADLRERLTTSFRLFASTIARHQVSTDGTEKLLLELPDGEHIECVLMREDDRRTVCVSTQVGCAMGCIFCASGLEGVKRNLSMGEILDQILRIDRLLPPDERITNIVVMGMGEPLANLKALIPALRTLNDKGGMGLGARRITVSTVGLPDQMRQLAEIDLPLNLAVSLHAPEDPLRSEIVPVNHKIGIAAILDAADYFFERTGRRVTYEYVLLADRNDGVNQAKQLAALLRGRTAHVNLIPMNPIAVTGLDAPDDPATRTFAETLRAGGVNVTIRKRKGADIDAACGQLRFEARRSKVEP